jgi:hypothetical protein
MEMKGMLAPAPAAAVVGLLVLSGLAGGLPGAAAATVRHAPTAGQAVPGRSAPPRTASSRTASSRTANGRVFGGWVLPNPGISSILRGVACTSSRNCWAVGSYENSTAELNEALHWDGSRWLRVAIPYPGTGHQSSLAAVTCISARNCWAVGSFDRGTTPLNEALHWDGTRWSKIATPQPGMPGNVANSLNGVSCVSFRDCWAVGSHTTQGGIGENAALWWNGARWSVVHVPEPGQKVVGDGRELSGVSCTTFNSCLAVGGYVGADSAELNDALRWNGFSWLRTTTANPGTGHHSKLTAVTCTSSSNCWAVGSYDHGAGQFNEALYWDGTSWSRVATPDPGTSGSSVHILNGVSCGSRFSCWAVGSHITDGIGHNVVLGWNGVSWSAVHVPQPGQKTAGDDGDTRELNGVSCTGHTHCVAVGGYISSAKTERNEALRWNGLQWLRSSLATAH